MKINDIRHAGAINNYRKNHETKSINTTGKKVSKTDEVQISAEAKMLSQQLANVSSSEERAETIRQLKEAIANNSYHVESDALADRMIHFLKNKL